MMRKGILFMLIGALMLFSIATAKDDWEKLSSDDKLKYIDDIVSVPDMKVWGTEYAVGENGKVWLQLLDENRHPIENSTCLLTVWFPNNTMMLNQTPMTYLDEGIHYRNFLVPDYTGVYPQTAVCSVPRLVANYSTTNYTIIAYDGLESGNGDGGTGWVSGWGFDSTGYCSVSSIGTPIGLYHIRCRGYSGKAFRVSYPSFSGIANITFWAKFEGLESGDQYHFEVFSEETDNWVTYRTWNDGEDDAIYRRYTFNVTGCYSGIIFRFRANAGLGDNGYFDNITVSQPTVLNYYQMNDTTYQYIFGSGEIHVSEPLSNLNTNVSLAVQEILDYIVSYGSQHLVSNHNICQDNTTLLKILTYENCIGSSCFTYQRNETVSCPRGCYEEASGEAYCIPSEFNIWILILAGIIVAVLIVGFILIKGWY